MSLNNTSCLLFVVGMHRSGTSALCAALHACGVGFGSYLLGPMQGVNEEGFWEDSEVVAVNELLLAQIGAHWYSVTEEHLEVDWQSQEFDGNREIAREVLKRNYGSGSLQAVKDPRFCITLPFWLDLCKEIGLSTKACVITRAPAEVGLSLKKRDGFPVGYGLHLFQVYRRGISKSAPDDSILVSYDDLVEHPGIVLRELSIVSSLSEDEELFSLAVKKELRHHSQLKKQGLLYRPDKGVIDFSSLAQEIEQAYPIDRTLVEFASSLVNRGKKLSLLGDLHSRALSTIDERDAELANLGDELALALATIDERDAQITQLGGEHTQALATIDERDAQITQLGREHTQALATIDERDAQITQLGREHTQALATIDERDTQLARALDKPGIGRLLRMLWDHEKR